MSIQTQGNSGTVLEVETNTRALRATQRPLDVGALGSYKMTLSTGTMAAGLAAASPIVSFRWTTTNICIVRRIDLALISLGTGFTAGTALLECVAARTFSASDTGGTAATLTGNNNKMRTSFGTTTVGDLRMSSTATLSAGTRTLDAQPFAINRFGITVTTNAVMLATTPVFYPQVGNGEYPLTLAQNEGFIIRATVPATGTWTGDVTIQWDEVTSF